MYRQVDMNDMDGLEVVPGQGGGANTITEAPHYVSGPEKSASRWDDGLMGAIEVDERYCPGKSTRQYPCGMRPVTFWLLVVIAVLIIGVAIGGGVGGSLANKGRRQPGVPHSSSTSAPTQHSTISTGILASPVSTTLATSTASTTSSAPVTSGTIGIALDPCPVGNGTTFTASDNSLFTLLCAVNWPKGEATANSNGTVVDLTMQWEYSLQSCIDLCVQWNASPGQGPSCSAVVYNANLTRASDAGLQGNCWLKNQAGQNVPDEGTTMAAGIIGA